MEKNPEYFPEIVYLRAIAILAVISIHVSAYFTKMEYINFLTLLYMSIDTFSSFAVPLFVCISGFVLYNKYKWPFSLKLFYKKRFKSVIPQYTIFSIFAILSLYIFYINTGKKWNFNAIDIIFMYLTGGTELGHLWFFLLIIQLYVLYPIIEKIFTISVKNNKTFDLLIFSLILPIFYMIISKNFSFVWKPFFLTYLFYFVFGMYVKFQYLYYKNKVISREKYYILFLPLLFATILGIADYLNLLPQYTSNFIFNVVYLLYYGIAIPIYNILIFILCLYIALKISKKIPNNISKFLQIIGKYSFGIYLIQGFIVFALASILFPKIGFDFNNWLFYPILFSLVLSLSLIFVFIINKLPYHDYIIGTSKTQ